MDAKALAKSKRAHSLHHSKKSHSTQKPKLPSHVANKAGIAENPHANQVSKRIDQFPSASALPSNWDRYEEEQNSVPGGMSGEDAKQISEVILPKSKGADYSHLITEAKSQRDLYTSLDAFPSLSDFLSEDFSCGVGSMVALRGENMLSWIGDDTFVVEDKTTGSSEASFLSLNLNALAEQLAKIDLARRLFIEKDLLPPELCTDGKEIKDQHPMEEFDYKETTQNVVESTPGEISDVINVADQNANVAASVIRKEVNYGRTQQGCMEQIKSPNSVTSQLNVNPIERESKKPPNFEVATAESELDMLLGSFAERDDLSNVHEEIPAGSTIPPGKGLDSSGAATKIADFDDSLDHLLEVTSNLKAHKGKSVHNDFHSSSPLSESKPEVSDDFDSWFDTIS